MALLSKLWHGFWDLVFFERHIIVNIQVHGQGRTVVKIDIEDPFQVKATSVLCLLGFGLGFGSVLLYRLYQRYYKHYSLHSQITAPGIDAKKARKRSRKKAHANGDACNDASGEQGSSDDDVTADDDVSSAPTGDSGNLTDLSPVSTDDKPSSSQPAMGNNVSRDDHFNTVHYDHYGNRVGFENYPWDPEGAPWARSPSGEGPSSASSSRAGPTSSASVSIPRRARPARPDPVTPGSAETYLEFLHNKFGALPPSIANGIANGDIDVERLLKSRDLDTLSGDMSLLGNFSPTSLYEKNLTFSDGESPDSGSCRRRREVLHHPLSEPAAADSPELGRRSASPTVYRRTVDYDSPFKRSVRSADDIDEDDDFAHEDIFANESHVDSFFDKLEKELLSLKSEIAEMDGTIEKLSSVPDSSDLERPRDVPRDLGHAGQVLKKYSARNSRANSVTSDRTPSEHRTFDSLDERTNHVTSLSPMTSSSSNNLPYHVHVHVHVHDDKKAQLELPIRTLCERDDEAMSLGSLADSQPISGEPSPSRDELEPITGPITNDVTNNNGDHQAIPRSPASDEARSTTVLNVGEVCDVITYAEREWRGNTDTAKTMLRGYQAIPERLSYSRLRRIRGDQYCALRSTLYQMFTHGLDVSAAAGSLQDVTEILHDRLNHKHQYLRTWSFAGRLPVTSADHVTDTMLDCLQALYNQHNSLSGLNCTERLEAYCSAVNGSRDHDVRMMEAVKILMMLNAIRLHDACKQGKEVPLFAWLMFARDTSSNPRALFRNHLDKVGGQHGLEQVELFLLADTLGVVLEVVRPSQFGEEDYITYFPAPASAPDSHTLTLIAEDDRHYNVNVLVP